MESYWPDSFAEYCGEYGGDEDSISDRDTWKRLQAFAASIADFLTADELDGLRRLAL